MAHETVQSMVNTLLGSDGAGGIIQDPSYSLSDCLTLFNRCQREVSGSFLLPALETEATITTDSGGSLSYVTLPTDFHRNLFRCYSATQERPIRVFGSLRQLHRFVGYVDRSGVVIGVAVRGTNLVYQRIPPTAETLKLYYYKQVTNMSLATDQPTALPEHLAEKLLVNFAAWRIFSEIEQGDEASVKTDRHFSLYQEALNELTLFLGPEQREPQEIPDEMNWDVYLNG